MKPKISFHEIEQAIANSKPEEQVRLLNDLPRLLRIHLSMSLLKTAEPSFDFWDNPDDRVYDRL